MTVPENDQSPTPPRLPQKAARKVDTPILVAILGAVGMIIAALFTLFGTMYETDRPIKATTAAQTAEAQITQRTSEQQTLQAEISPTLGTSTLAPATNLSATLVVLAVPSPTNTMTPGPVPSLTPLPDPSWSEEQLRVYLTIQRELDAIAEDDLPTLREIYTEDAVVVDIRGTPDDQSDDLVYQGWDAIRQRLLKTFTYGWVKVTPVGLRISIDQDMATANHRGIVVNEKAYDQHVAFYELQRIGDQWRIVRLEFDYR